MSEWRDKDTGKLIFKDGNIVYRNEIDMKIIKFWNRVKTRNPRRSIGFRYCADNRRKSKDIDSHPVTNNLAISPSIKNTQFWKMLVQVVSAIFIAQLVIGLIVVVVKWLMGGYG